jgi:hypothetical protein
VWVKHNLKEKKKSPNSKIPTVNPTLIPIASGRVQMSASGISTSIASGKNRKTELFIHRRTNALLLSPSQTIKK